MMSLNIIPLFKNACKYWNMGIRSKPIALIAKKHHCLEIYIYLKLLLNIWSQLLIGLLWIIGQLKNLMLWFKWMKYSIFLNLLLPIIKKVHILCKQSKNNQHNYSLKRMLVWFLKWVSQETLLLELWVTMQMMLKLHALGFMSTYKMQILMILYQLNLLLQNHLPILNLFNKLWTLVLLINRQQLLWLLMYIEINIEK